MNDDNVTVEFSVSVYEVSESAGWVTLYISSDTPGAITYTLLHLASATYLTQCLKYLRSLLTPATLHRTFLSAAAISPHLCLSVTLHHTNALYTTVTALYAVIVASLLGSSFLRKVFPKTPLLLLLCQPYFPIMYPPFLMLT